MGRKFTPDEKLILNLLKIYFSDLPEEEMRKKISILTEEAEQSKKTDWETVFCIGRKHGITALLYDAIRETAALDRTLEEKVSFDANATVLQNYRLLFLGRSVLELLEKKGIRAAILKGCCTGSFYPVPELRKTGDLDILLLEKARLNEACKLLEESGFIKEEVQQANHHVSYKTKKGIDVELHILLTEPLDHEETNKIIEKIQAKCQDHIILQETMGIEVSGLDEGYHSYYLLLHMLQHFLRAGFGLKLFCDWTAFWRKKHSEKEMETFLDLVKESGLLGFARVVTAACVAYLGLDGKKVSILFEGRRISVNEAEKMSRDMMYDVVEAEEFGRSNNDRMVIMLDTGLPGYIREFHHQMRLNFPKTGKIVILWPALWCVTLYRFLRNNRTVRKTSGLEILNTARKRSRLIKDMELFERKP